MKKIILAVCAILVFATGSAHATMAVYSTLASWDQYGQPGNQASTPGISTTLVTADNMVRGPGLGVNTGANSLNSTGWSGTDAGDYIQFGFTVAQGYTATLGELWIGTRSSATGPGTIGFYSSLDNYATPFFTLVQGNATYENTIVDLSGLGQVSGSFSVRLIEIGDTQADGVGATATSGTFRISDYTADGGVTFVDTQFTGQVSAVPTPIPAAAWLLGSGLLGLVGMRRRKA